MVAISVCEQCKAGSHCYGSSNRPAIHPGVPGGYVCVCKCSSMRVELHHGDERGRILEIAFIGSESDNPQFLGATFVEEEIARHCPTLLIINLLDFDPNFGNALIGALVRASQSMNGAVRVVARAETAGKLQHAFAVMKLENLFDKRIFADRESALNS